MIEAISSALATSQINTKEKRFNKAIEYGLGCVLDINKKDNDLTEIKVISSIVETY